MKKDWGKR